MWNSQMPSAFEKSSHEFFDSFGLSDSITKQPQSRGPPLSNQKPFSSPGQNPQGNHTPFQPSTQAANASPLFEPPPARAQNGEVPTPPVGGYGQFPVENPAGQHQQKPTQALNTTAMLFSSSQSGEHSFPPQSAVDPFNTGKVTPSKAGGTSSLFSGQDVNDPFDRLSSASQNIQSFGPPPSVAFGYQMPAMSSGINTEKKHSVEQLEAFSGHAIKQTQPFDKAGPSVTKPGAGDELVAPPKQSFQGSDASPPQIPPPNSNVPGFTQDNSFVTSSLFSGTELPTASQDAASDTWHTGDTIPGLDMVKKTYRAVEPPVASDSDESFGNVDVTKNVAPPTLQPPSLDLYPPTMVNGIDQSFNPSPQRLSLYPPGLTSAQPVSQSDSLYPPGMDLGQSNLSPSASTGELLTPNPNILPSNLGVPIFEHVEGSRENDVASCSQSAPPDVESTTASSEMPVSGCPAKDQRDETPVEQNELHLSSQPMEAHESFDLEAVGKEKPPITEPLKAIHSQSVEPVAGTIGEPQLGPNVVAFHSGSGLSDNHPATTLQTVLETVIAATSGVADEAFKPTMTVTPSVATHDVVSPSKNQQVQPFQGEVASTIATYDIVSPSNNQQVQPFQPEVTPTVASYDVVSPSNNQQVQSFQPKVTPTIATYDVVSPSNNQQVQPFQPEVTSTKDSCTEPETPQLNTTTKTSHKGTQPLFSERVLPSKLVTEPFVSPTSTDALHSEPGAFGGTTISSAIPHISAHVTQGNQFASSAGGQNVTTHEDKNTTFSHGESLDGHPQQVLPKNTTATLSPVGIDPPANVSTEGQGELHSSPSSAFIPVKANSPSHYEQRRNTESPLRSPVQREKQEALLPGPRVQTSSLWDSEPQFAMPGLIVPTAGKVTDIIPGTKQSSQHEVPARSSNNNQAGQNIARSVVGIPGFTQTVYPLGDKPSTELISSSTSHDLPSVPSTQPPPPLNEAPKTSPFTEGSTRDTASDLSRQSSFGVLNQDPTLSYSPHDLLDQVSGLNQGQGPNINEVPSVTSLPSSNQITDHHSQQFAPALGTVTGLPQHTIMHSDASRSAVQTGKPQNEQGTSGDLGSGKSGGMVAHYGASPSDDMSNQRGYGASDGHLASSGDHDSGKSTGIVNQYGVGSDVSKEPGLGVHGGNLPASGGHGSAKSESVVTHYGAGPSDGLSNQRGYGSSEGNLPASGGHGSGQNEALQLQYQQQLQYHQQQLYLQQQRQQHQRHSHGQQQLPQQTQQSPEQRGPPGHQRSGLEQYLQQQQQLQQSQQLHQKHQQQQLQQQQQQQLHQQQQQQLYEKQQQQQEQLQQKQEQLQQTQEQSQQHQQQFQQHLQQQHTQYQQQLLHQTQEQFLHQQQQQQMQEHQQQQLYQQQQQLYQQQQQSQQHQQLQRQSSGQLNTNVASELQQYEDFDSEEECNRYYDESRKWFWSYKRNQWIRADRSKREAEQLQDERYSRTGSGRRRYDDAERERGKRRRERRRDGRYARNYDDPYREYYYDQRDYDHEYRRRESYSSESSGDSQRRVSRSERSSRAESPRSVSSRSSSRARRTGRHSKHGDHDYEDSYRGDAEYYRSQQSSRSSRRLSSASVGSSTSGSLSDIIKWNDQPKQLPNSELTGDYTVERAVTPERLTPNKHNAPHIVGKFSSVSCLSLAPPRRILDGETAEVFIADVTSDPKPNQMQSFPGPLSRGGTHKRDVVKFAKNQALFAFNNTTKSFEEREASYILWQVLAVMVQQNGVYLSTDIAEVLTGELPENVSSVDERSPASSRRVSFGSEAQIFPEPCSHQHQVTTFRELLLCGKTQDALEYAVDSKMWGHAFTLAHKLDQNVFANIMSRFTSNLNEDDSLLCLYQHLSQNRPAIIDKKSKRWRKHLAIMIANPSKDPEQDKRNIHILGENLESRGLIEAAHLCYILAGKPISKQNGTVLLGYSLHDVRPEFVDLLAIQRTEIFEYAMNLKDENYIIKDFQPWKAFYAHSLADAGLHVKAFRYCEIMVNSILKYLPTVFTENTIIQVHTLSLRLTQREQMTPFLNMNDKLAQLLQLIQGGTTDLRINTSNQPTTEQMTPQQDPSQDTSSSESRQYENCPQEMTVNQTIGNAGEHNVAQTTFVPSLGSNPPLQEAEEPSLYRDGHATLANFIPQSEAPTGQSDLYNMPYTSGFGSQESALPPGNQPYGDVAAPETVAQYSYGQSVPRSVEYGEDFYEGDSFDHLRKQPNGASTETTGLSTSTADNFDYYSASKFRNEDVQKPDRSATKEEKAEEVSGKSEKDEKKLNDKDGKQGSGWSFGGFFKSLIPKGKNEMKLPDDTKKTIYWDEKEGRWINTDESEEDKTDLPPPPIDPSLVSGAPPAMPAIPSSTAGEPTPTSGTSNASQLSTPTSFAPVSNTPKPPLSQASPAMPATFKPEQPEASLVNSPLTTPSRFSRRALGSKGRRSNYVDVLGASGGTTKLNQTASPMLFSPFPTLPVNEDATASPFIPNSQPITDGTSEPVVSENNVVGNKTEEEASNAQDSLPPAPVPLLNPSNFTPSPSRSRGRQYPFKR